MSGRIHDVIVVGGGPAGATAARQCALKGLDTLLIEKKEFPRDKPCAGGVTQWALSNLDFEVPRDIIEMECFGLRVFFKGGSSEADGASRFGVLVSRASFDTLLLEKAREAGAQVVLGRKATGFRATSGHVEVTTGNGPVQGQCLVVAEGAMGGLAPGIRGPFGKKVAVAMVTEVESSQEEIERRTEGRVQIDFDVAYRGYGWVFPHRGYYSVGIGGMRGRIANPTQLLKSFLARHGFDGTRRKFRGHFIPAGGIRRTVASDRVLLVGDAAGFVDSFVGEGIGYAIVSGKLAAETIHDALKEGNLSREVLASYQENCDAHFGERLRYAYFLAMVLHSLPGVFLRVLATHQEAVQKLLRVGMWEISYREFLVWLLAKTPLYLLKRPPKYQNQDVLGDPLRL